MTEDLSAARGPTAAELKVLERLGRRRRAIEAVSPADDGDVHVLARALSTLDDMEECLCEEGAKTPELARGWEVLDQLEARLPAGRADSTDGLNTSAVHKPEHELMIVPIRRRQPATPTVEDAKRPPILGDQNLTITAIETLRSVAHRAVEDPQPPNCAAKPNRKFSGLATRLAALIAGLLAEGIPAGGILRIIAQALATFLPLLDEQPAADPVAAKGPSIKTAARLDLLRQERSARASERRTPSPPHRARPDRPPTDRGVVALIAVQPEVDVWNDLLDLTSETLETFIVRGDTAGAGHCAELLDLLAETFATNRPEAA